MWISGPKHFLEMTLLPPTANHVYCLTNAGRRVPSELKSINWAKLCHINVGGMTNARGSFGVSVGSPEISLKRDLMRSIGHVLKQSVRPRVSDPNPSEEHYRTCDLLSISFPRVPVLYPTFMSRTGWGMRSLSDEELSLAFELPDYVAWNDRFLRDIVPLQLCRAVVEFLTENGVTEAPLRRVKTNRSEVANDSSNQDVVWLPLIKRWLSGAWADAHIADKKAVKSDDSPVDFRPWYRRIQLIFPCRISTLGVFERSCMRRWQANACNSLFIYLSQTYGSSWRDSFC